MARAIVNVANGNIGDIRHSMLTLTQFQAANGTGWVLADGSSCVGTAYATLTGNTTVPDARGLFLRGAGTRGTAINAITYNGGSLGAVSGDQIQGHKHLNLDPSGGTVQSMGVASGSNFYVDSYVSVANGSKQTGSPITDSTNGTPRTGSETRPANLAVNIFIKVN